MHNAREPSIVDSHCCDDLSAGSIGRRATGDCQNERVGMFLQRVPVQYAMTVPVFTLLIRRIVDETNKIVLGAETVYRFDTVTVIRED